MVMPHSPKLPSSAPAFETNAVGSSHCCCHTICPPKRHVGSRACSALPGDWGVLYPALCCSLLILPFVWQLVGCRRFHFQNRELQCAKKLISFFKGKLLSFTATSTKFWCQQGDYLLQVFSIHISSCCSCHSFLSQHCQFPQQHLFHLGCSSHWKPDFLLGAWNCFARWWKQLGLIHQKIPAELKLVSLLNCCFQLEP